MDKRPTSLKRITTKKAADINCTTLDIQAVGSPKRIAPNDFKNLTRRIQWTRQY